MEQGPKTVDQLMATMRESIAYSELRLGFVKEQYPYPDGKETKAALEEVKAFIESPLSREHFNQWFDYAVLFDGELRALGTEVAAAEQEHHRSNLYDNEALKKSRAIAEALALRVRAAHEMKLEEGPRAAGLV